MEMREVEIWTITRTDQGNAVILRPLGSDLIVPVFIGHLEIQSILIGAGGTKAPRPLTHDLILSVLRHGGLSLNRVEVHALKNNTFHARLVIYGGQYSEKRPLVLDARSSDALALAVRQKCPILMSRRILEQTGIPADFISEGAGDSDAGPPSDSPVSAASARPDKYRLIEELNQAVNAEEYERAAEIRDLLIRLDKERQDRER
jgi:bifunctional DNase/RNase